MRTMPAEWEPQSGVLLAWPHEKTDWSENLLETEQCYRKIIGAISEREKVFLLTHDVDATRKKLDDLNLDNILLINADYDDTWARDFGPITVTENGEIILLDFKFNGWGEKFDAQKDNRINKALQQTLFKGVKTEDHNQFVLEGGSIESDGKGTILTTSHCLIAENRNQPKTREEIQNYLLKSLGAERIIWLEYGWLEGDDTDGHIDTLARFCNETTIAYVKCDDHKDSHYHDLRDMENELKELVDLNGRPYQLIPLPMPSPVYAPDGRRLPSTYANFLIINGAVLMPVYNCEQDDLALQQMVSAFPDHDIIGINCLPLILQHGSLHCVTMHLPKGI